MTTAMQLLTAFVICITLPVSQTFIFGDSPDWTGLRATFGLNIFSSKVFSWLPRTKEEAEDNGWVKVGDCNSNSKFRGNRYVKDNDYSVIVLLDKNGYVAGIQCGLLADGVPNFPPAPLRSVYQTDGPRYTLTAYFTDPATICTTGRTSDQFDRDGTGTRLYIQNGTDPVANSILIPANETDLPSSSQRWTKGKCFYWMGEHYWYDTTVNMSCDNFFPVFLLYNKGRLNAFGWAIGIMQNSDRFEHPTGPVLSKFFDPVPQCLYNQTGLSTMHIYLTRYATLNFC